MWLLLAFVSATLLGLYDVVKKISLERNAVIPVLFLNIFFCCHLYLTGDKINLEPGLKFTGIMNFVISLTD